MQQVSCIKKYRGRDGCIYAYDIIDINGNVQTIKDWKLKREIYNKHLEVTNLKLTTDHRLIDRKREH